MHMLSAGSLGAIRLGVIADDFTGASDVASAIRKGGLATVLAFNGCPASVPDGFACVVVALKTRSIPAADAIRQSLAALAGLQRLGARQIIFKVCSTFDSTPAGNIGPVTEAIAAQIGIPGAVVVTPAFPDAKRTVYGGHLFVGDRLLSESGMESHPLNPMTDPDIRRWLAAQSKGAVGYLPLSIIHAGEDAIRTRLGEEATAGRRLVIADAVENSDLATMGRAIADALLVVGASGVAIGLAPVHAAAIGSHGAPTSVRRVDGPGLVLAGSCSKATLGQIARYAGGHPALAIDADAIIAGQVTPQDGLAFIAGHPDDAVLIYSSVEPAALVAVQARHGAEKVAAALEAFFGALAVAAVAGGVRRLAIAGGETSGAVVTALDLKLLEVGQEIAVGVPALAALDRALALALKSGNFGEVDFFETALAALGDN